MSDSDAQSAIIELLANIGRGMRGLAGRIERLEQERSDGAEKDVTFDDQIEYLENLLKDRHFELIRRRRAYVDSVSEMRRTEAYLGELHRAAKAITASMSIGDNYDLTLKADLDRGVAKQ